MSRLSFDTAEVLVYDPVSGNRNATRAALYTIGFRRIETVATIEAFVESVRRRPPDLAVCEAQGNDIELCKTIQNLRQGVSVYNPFIIVIVTAWEQTSTLVARVLNCGADDLLLRPFSTTTLSQRIRNHVERRKSFVITTDYVGPDRRHDNSRPNSANLFEPPNSLRMKAQDRLTSEEATQRLDRELKQARDVLTTEKLRRDAFQLCVLWRLLQSKASASGTFEVDLAKLKEKTRAIARRCLDTEFEDAASQCQSVLAAIEGLEAGVDRNASMHLLGESALALNEMLSPEKTRAEHMDAVEASVALVKARMTPPAAVA
ncbi:MAG TPA: response regulator [Rhizomicrobium sp.]|nr:response regulator [Rhizomicrobium sp.]